MRIKHYVNINDMILNIISVPISLIIFERFHNGCTVSKSKYLDFERIYIFFLMPSLVKEISDT